MTALHAYDTPITQRLPYTTLLDTTSPWPASGVRYMCDSGRSRRVRDGTRACLEMPVDLPECTLRQSHS